jgi:hypothetical protein
MVVDKTIEETARVRGGWLLHPRGQTFEATVQAAEVLEPGRYPAVVRLSKATPTPGGWPDMRGMGLRIFLGRRHVDLLMTTTGRAPLLRYVLVPRLRTAAAYTTVASLRDPYGRRRYLAALPRRDGAFVLAIAGVTSRWHPWGRLTIGAPVIGPAPLFDPTGHLPPGLYARGLLQHLRARAYPASQRARR